MNSKQRLLGLALLMSVAAIGTGANIDSGTAICQQRADHSKCQIRWDLSTTPRAFYRVQRLSVADRSWVNVDRAVFTVPYAAGHDVDVGGLYRVLACDDRAASNNCTSSTAVWAAKILPVEEIPAEVRISNGDGTFSVAEISKNLDAKHQNIQYNVYRLSDLVNRVGAAEQLIPMTPPVEPGAADDIEHEIQHNVHTAYVALRELYEKKLALDKE